jgi:hypothetical protein
MHSTALCHVPGRVRLADSALCTAMWQAVGMPLLHWCCGCKLWLSFCSLLQSLQHSLQQGQYHLCCILGSCRCGYEAILHGLLTVIRSVCEFQRGHATLPVCSPCLATVWLSESHPEVSCPPSLTAFTCIGCYGDHSSEMRGRTSHVLASTQFCAPCVLFMWQFIVLLWRWWWGRVCCSCGAYAARLHSCNGHAFAALNFKCGFVHSCCCHS